ncbi:helix-turn-helix transcriptional regulator [Sanguibacter sp. Leaf3]|uniref:helix-turn-helix transcriptional regulator n=1 Tax=Sanguibacter sp. Leaf3 TaxID=1736209 RepID=UPI0006FB91A3|nr:WYL domain-containing protein [Sanguibacter sp. Leaf3]KQT98246.1 transcriptional regulator [Sanguibacter sp. Leaf3]
MPATTPPAARLLNLVIALMNTPLRMTKDDVRASVAGYDEAATTEAFERMFERDKDSLRALGVPIVTVDSGGHAQDVGYRIDKDAYALEEVDLTPAELGVLSLAAQFWQDSAVAVDTTRALTKLRSAGESAELGEAADAVAGLAPQVRSVSDAYETLLDAVVERRAVTFTYRAASTGQVLRRTVEPWRVVVRDGGWYLLGHDQDRRAARAFKLTRVEGPVRATGPAGAFDIPADLDADALIGLRRPAPLRSAVLALRPERAGALRARARVHGDETVGAVPGRDVVVVDFTSVRTIADEVAGYGDAVVVLDPPDVRAAVIDRLLAATRLTGPTEGAHRG